MKKEQIKKIKAIFYNNKGYASTKEITSQGINRYYISELENKGYITRIKTGLYKWNDFEYESELVEVSKIVPQGVLCLKSALSYYELTTYNPWQYEVAVERSSRITLPEYPPIKLVFFSVNQYEAGINEVEINEHKVRIYDIEKTICDCIRYRNKIGIDIVKEALKDYIKRNNKDFNKLMKYGKVCRIEKILKKYLEVLV